MSVSYRTGPIGHGSVRFWRLRTSAFDRTRPPGQGACLGEDSRCELPHLWPNARTPARLTLTVGPFSLGTNFKTLRPRGRKSSGNPKTSLTLPRFSTFAIERNRNETCDSTEASMQEFSQ
jgi:hypothetical protein